MRSTIKILFVTMIIVIYNIPIIACPICEKSQPKITAGLTHGAGPQSNWDWLIIAVITLITVLTFIYSLKFLIKPGEQNSDHIKKTILIN